MTEQEEIEQYKAIAEVRAKALLESVKHCPWLDDNSKEVQELAATVFNAMPLPNKDGIALNCIPHPKGTWYKRLITFLFHRDIPKKHLQTIEIEIIGKGGSGISASSMKNPQAITYEFFDETNYKRLDPLVISMKRKEDKVFANVSPKLK